MRKYISLSLLLLILFFCLSPLAVASQSEPTTPDEKAEALLNGILKAHGTEGAEKPLQAFVDGHLVQQAGITSEWYVLALAQWKECDFSNYEKALLAYLENRTVSSASTRLKYALCLAAIGSTDSYISKTMNDSIGKQGLMSWAFGLHLLNNGYKSTLATAEEAKNALLSLQRADGGWSVMGETGDADATAITLQALAPFQKTDASVEEAILRGVQFLSRAQHDDGSFSSYGVSNPESASQVLLALTALDRSYETEEAFQKNGNTVWDGILRFVTENGALSHTLGGDENDSASSQAFMAAVSILRKDAGKGSLFLLDLAKPEEVEPAPSEESNPQEKKWDYRILVTLIFLGLGGIASLLLILGKRANKKNFLALGIILVAGILLIWCVKFQSAEEYYQSSSAKKENVIGTVTLSIQCGVVAGQASHIPENGIILEETEFEIQAGDTVYSILTEAAKAYKIQIENNGTSRYAYITGIQYLYETDFGDLSGWVYLVNGKRPSLGAGEIILQDGDRIEWHYSLNLGEDLPDSSNQ